jgi:hypothetical protein
LALLNAVKNDYFTKTEKTVHWFSHRDDLYVQYFRAWNEKETPKIIICTDGGYRLHLTFPEFEQLLAKLRELIKLDTSFEIKQVAA